jgi:hypothetical protein
MRVRQLRCGQADAGTGLPARTAYAALAWVVVFFAFHVYWYAGGSFGRGGALLALRGGSGQVDDLTRAAGLLPNGITGLSLEEAMGTAHPSASELWSGRATDAYFAVGGLIFGLLAWRYWTRPVARSMATARRRH